MAQRTGLKTGSVSTFVCGQVVDETVLNNLNDLAASMRERGETVINQHGHRWVNSEKPILMGQCDHADFTTYPSIENTWRFENSGYTKFLLDLRFFLGTTAYSAGANDTSLYTRILIQHVDNTTTSDLWDSEVESPTRGSEQTDTITGTFANPPASGQTEIEKIVVTVYSNRAAASSTISTTNATGLISLTFKLYDDL